MVPVTTRRLLIAAVSLLVVLLVLVVVALVVWRNDVADREHRARYEECMEFRGLDTFNPDVDVEEFAEHAAECGELAQQ